MAANVVFFILELDIVNHTVVNNLSLKGGIIGVDNIFVTVTVDVY